ncbi:MAG: VOC family protein [Deltaproteobacteria bacterium]|nr:VOC family protein [Deltaproteobacteria bacterium]
MHRSRLATVVIDCAEDDFARGRQFWSAALGKAVLPRDERYATLKGRVGGKGGVFVGFQRVPSDERAVHFDIETDDVEAEVARLEKLGARVKRRIRRHVVMEAPSRHAFCVVPVRRGDFPVGTTEWP